MTDSGGPFREQDPVLSRLDKLDATTARISDDLQKWGHLAAGQAPSRTAVLARWFGSPLIVIALAWSAATLFGACSEGCRADDAAKARLAQADADGELRDHERFCAAVGLRFAGLTPVVVIPDHTDARGYRVEAVVHYGVVCGNGHGDGMYVGVDGHLHALKEP
jgi:hypothetical protein